MYMDNVQISLLEPTPDDVAVIPPLCKHLLRDMGGHRPCHEKSRLPPPGRVLTETEIALLAVVGVRVAKMWMGR